MSKIEEFFSHCPGTKYQSNFSFPASTLPGWLYLESGALHVFIAPYEKGEYGQRHFIMTLHPGDCFPPCTGLAFPEENGQEHVYLLVSQTESLCRYAGEKEFSEFFYKNHAEASTPFNRLIAGLRADWTECDSDSVVPCCVDVITMPEIVREMMRHILLSIASQRDMTAKDITTEQCHQQNMLQSKFSRLQNLVRAKPERVEKHSDPLFAALQIITRQYNLQIHVDPADEHSADPESRLIQFCAINQWRTRRLQLENGFSRLHHSPMIGFHDADGRPCIFELKADESVWYFPGEDTKHRLNPKTEKELKSFAYCFYESFPNRSLVWRDLARFLFKNTRRTFLGIILVGVLVGLFGLVTPVATRYVTGKIIPTANYIELWQLLVLLVSLTAGTAVLNTVPQLSVLLLGSSFLERFLAALFDRIFRLPVYFFHRFDAGDLCTRLFAAIRVQESIFQVVSQQFIGSIFSFCSLILLFYYSWRLTLFAVPLALIYAAVLLYLFTRLQSPLRTAVNAAGRESGFLKQAFDGIAKIRGAGAESRIENRFLDEFTVEKTARSQCGRGMGRTAVAAVIFPAAANMVFFYLIGDLWRGSMETPSFLAFLSAYGSFQAGMISVGEGVWQLASQKPELERLEVFWKSEVESPEGKPQAAKLDGSVELSHVTFGYDPALPPVLRDISLSARPGEFVAIVGPSGAGKSSLVRLLLGFEYPSNGSVLYGGQDLRELDVNSIRRQLGVILQNSRIMPGSILENITTGTSCSLAEAEKAVRLAALDRDIDDMPMGIFTSVADGLVSGGQQQRILIARALIGNPAIIVMDESTSALDNETQEEVRRNLENLKATRIVIAHRLSTIINADRIYVLERGEIRESGTFPELMAQDGVFQKLARRQML